MNYTKTDVCIIGAGPAGLMAAIRSSENKAAVTVVEAGSTAGRKLLLTGGGRCNLTNERSIAEFVRAFAEKASFVRHCIFELPPLHLRKFFADRGVATIVQSDGCVFAGSGKSSDIRNALVSQAKELGVNFIYGKRTKQIEKSEDGFCVFGEGLKIQTKKIIIATGGLSYPQTGSTGDGLKFAQRLGHKIIEPTPALVPLVTKETWIGRFAGVSLSAVKISVKRAGARPVITKGALVFTQTGLGGPAALDASRYIVDWLSLRKGAIPVLLDTLAEKTSTELEKEFLLFCEMNPKKSLKNILGNFFPDKFAAHFCSQFGFDADAAGRQLERRPRKDLLRLLKALPLTITGTRPIEEATITRGGVSTAEIDSKTMESKICPGLYFAGEVIDVDGPCGGFNLQFAFSSGALAGCSATA